MSSHIGKKISRLREMRDIKQETLADTLGISQQAVSKLEQSEKIEDTTLDRVAKALGMTADTIRNFDEEKTIMNIQNNYEGSHLSNSANTMSNCTFNPLDKLMEALEENKRLYEALLKEKEERIKIITVRS